MAKRGISRVRGKSWDGKVLKLRPDANINEFDPTTSLRDPKKIHAAILSAMVAGEYEAMVDIFKAHLRVINRTRAAKSLGVSRQYVHKMLRSSAAPSLRTFAKFLTMVDAERRARAEK